MHTRSSDKNTESYTQQLTTPWTTFTSCCQALSENVDRLSIPRAPIQDISDTRDSEVTQCHTPSPMTPLQDCTSPSPCQPVPPRPSHDLSFLGLPSKNQLRLCLLTPLPVPLPASFFLIVLALISCVTLATLRPFSLLRHTHFSLVIALSPPDPNLCHPHTILDTEKLLMKFSHYGKPEVQTNRYLSCLDALITLPPADIGCNIGKIITSFSLSTNLRVTDGPQNQWRVLQP